MKIRLVMGCTLSLLVAGCAAPAGEPVRITAEPAGASIADSVRVEVDGLAAGEAVRIWARTADREGQRWESSAEFTADGAGRVDTTSAASTGGTYRGLDPHGLFWSMRLAEGLLPPYPLVRADEVVIELGVDRAAATAATTVLRRVVRAAGVRSIPVDEPGLVGDLHLPAGTGPWPGVLLLGGSEGGRPDPAFAALLAGRGYAVLGLAYFGGPGLPPALSRIPVEYGLAGARRLAERPEVAGARIGVIGTSKGAEYALLLASTEPERFAAVVSHVGSDIVWPAIAFDPGGPPASSWTRGGTDVPFLSWAPSPDQSAPDQTAGAQTRSAAPAPGKPVRVADAYAGAVARATPEQLAAARIPVERIAGPVLLTSGGDDGIWPSAPQSERLMSTLAAAGNPHGSRHLQFPGAGHFVGGVPNLPTTSTSTAAGPIAIEAGGDPAANAAAVRESWAATVGLLERALRE